MNWTNIETSFWAKADRPVYNQKTVDKIGELAEQNYYDGDMYEFIKEHSEEDFVEYYEVYVEMGEKYSYDAVDAFLTNWRTCDLKNFDSFYVCNEDWNDFVEQKAQENILCRVDDAFHQFFDYDAYGEWLSDDYIELNGFIFDKNG